MRLHKTDVPEKRKKRGSFTSVQSDTYDITQGQEEETPTLHREGLSCAVDVPSTREGELLLWKHSS